MSADKRMETGPVVFGNDWTGLFIRGDACFSYLNALDLAIASIEKSSTANDHNPKVSVAILKGLKKLLKSTDERVKTDREVPKYYEMPKERG